MKTFFLTMLVCIPVFLVFGIWAAIENKRYNEGARAVDQLIKKTRLIAVNGVDYVTNKGMITNAIIGHMLAGNIGAFLGAMSAEQVHRENEFTFLVLYNEGKKGSKREVEKVRQSSGRFQFLVSKLEDDPEKEEPTKPVSKPKQVSSPTPLPSPEPIRRAQNSGIKTVNVPVGEYVVGEDIPAGSYTLTSDEYAYINISKDQDAKSHEVSYACEEPSFIIGKIILKDGMRVRIDGATMRFAVYSVKKLWDLLEAKKPAAVYSGDYIIGEDIPEGSYTLTSKEFSYIYIYDRKDSESYDASYECEDPDYIIGKVPLKNGMRIQVNSSGMTFEPFKGLGF